MVGGIAMAENEQRQAASVSLLSQNPLSPELKK
jgi:hypothetical protein